MKRYNVICFGMVLWACEVATSQAAIYMLIPSIQGEATEQAHAGWVEVQSLSWSHSEAPPGAQVKVQFGRVIFTKTADSTSAALALAAADQHQFREVKVEFVRSFAGTPVVVYRMKLTNPRLVSYSAGGQSNNLATENLAWEFDTITWIAHKVSPQGQAGPGTAGCWDTIGNRSCPATP